MRHLTLGFIALLGCAPAFAAAPAVTCPPAKPHVVTHHRMVRHYVSPAPYRVVWAPSCGSVTHPCNVDHLTVPVQ